MNSSSKPQHHHCHQCCTSKVYFLHISIQLLHHFPLFHTLFLVRTPANHHDRIPQSVHGP
ncbi:hypothetical protein HanXRQr2_Chr11g0497931 [Helianthus annuus]|uniref:Uncharacterized protein n=1 Tax=Helianthus annuus TaxID=4232 RepID=A0A9K3N114_HELAN|nr:hypothetical protein HanXRQr2_Chr11g0497931 [Helianthus annuus]KAJ0875723.1 hypothetical protein HanPSC8_Chr11g0479881 [Helianthus annuus]